MAVSVALSPLQIVAMDGEMDAVGVVLNVTVCEAVAEQLAPILTVTVYVVVLVGETVIAAVFEPLLQA